MLDINKTIQAIRSQLPQLQRLHNDNIDLFEFYSAELDALVTQNDPDLFLRRLIDRQIDFVGAYPLESMQPMYRQVCPMLRCPADTDHWKQATLANRTVMSVDGSQIYPDKNIGLSIGAIQIAWFIKHNNPSKAPVKDLDFRLVIPEQMSDEEFNWRTEIDMQRTLAELQKTTELLRELSTQTHDKFPVVFVDGSFTVSFEKNQERRLRYTRAIADLIALSQQVQIPVIAFVDTSLAANFVRSISHAKPAGYITDAGLLRHHVTEWGHRSIFFGYHDGTAVQGSYLDDVGFFFVKPSSSDARLSRVEVPRWVHERGWLDEVAQVLLAECLINNGYPYVIETADSVAVLHGAERDMFFRILGSEAQLDMNTSRKLASKDRRRSIRIVS